MGHYDFSLEKGKIYGLICSNDREKSLLFESILDLSKYGRETILCGFNLRASFSNSIKDVKCMVEINNLYEYLSACENLRCYALYYKVTFDKISFLIDLFDIDKSNLQFKSFSQDMKCRLALGISFLHDFRFLILDEFLNGLDIKEVVRLRDLFLSFEDKVIIFCSKDISKLESIVDEVFLVRDGQVCLESINIQYENLGYKQSKILKKSYVKESKSDNLHKGLAKVNDDSSLEDMLISMFENECNYKSDC